MATADTENAIINDALARHRIGFARLSRRTRYRAPWSRRWNGFPPSGVPASGVRSRRPGTGAARAIAEEGKKSSPAECRHRPIWREDDHHHRLDAVAQTYSLVGAQAFGASEQTELMLARERRERRLRRRTGEAARRRARINGRSIATSRRSGARSRPAVASRPDNRLRQWPRIVADFCGRALPALLGADVGNLLAPDEGSGWDALAPPGLFVRAAPDERGRRKCLDLVARGLAPARAGGPDEYQAVGRDITPLKKLQAEIELGACRAQSALWSCASDCGSPMTCIHDRQALVAVVAIARRLEKVATRAPDRILPELRHAEEVARAGLESGARPLGQVRFQRAGLEVWRRRFGARRAASGTHGTECHMQRIIAGTKPNRWEVLKFCTGSSKRPPQCGVHAQASCVTLKAHLTRNEIEIVVSDDGRRFRSEAIIRPLQLSGMHGEAIVMIPGGRLTVETEIDGRAHRARPCHGVAGLCGDPGFAER